MIQAMDILVSMYPKVFDRSSLKTYIDDLLFRFCNYSLGDTVFRVGKDLARKLRFDDRFFGGILAAEERGLDWSLLREAYISAFSFCCEGPDGKLYEPDRLFLNLLNETKFAQKVYFASCWEKSGLPLDLYERINVKFMPLLDRIKTSTKIPRLFS